MYLCFVAFTFRHIFSAAGCFEHDSIAQQQGTEAARNGVLRASQGRLYPPWSLMLALRGGARRKSGMGETRSSRQ
jgi:hypothetical protein